MTPAAKRALLRHVRLPPLIAGLALSAAWGLAARWWSETSALVVVLDAVPPQVWLPLPALALMTAWRSRQLVPALVAAAWAALLLVQAGLVVPGPRTGAEANGAPFTVLTLNTDFAGVDVGALADLVRREDVSAVLLQEALDRDRDALAFARRLRRALPGWTFTRHDELVTLTRQPPSSSRVVRYPGSLHAALETTIQTHGLTVRLVNVHLPTLGLPLSERDRRLSRSVTQAVERRLAVRRSFLTVAARWAEPSAPIVLAGDLNAPPRGELWRRLHTQGWQDAFAAAGSGFGFTHHARLGHSRIDAVLTRGARAERVRTVTLPGSDHRAVVALLRWPAP